MVTRNNVYFIMTINNDCFVKIMFTGSEIQSTLYTRLFFRINCQLMTMQFCNNILHIPNFITYFWFELTKSHTDIWFVYFNVSNFPYSIINMNNNIHGRILNPVLRKNLIKLLFYSIFASWQSWLKYIEYWFFII